MSLNFQSKENQNIIKDIIIDSLKKDYGPSLNNIWSSEYDKSIQETMNFVEGKVSKDVLKTMDEEEYLVKMNRKVFSIIQPIINQSIKTDILKNNSNKNQNNYQNQNQNNNLYNEYEKAKQREIESSGKKRVTFNSEGTNTRIRSGNVINGNSNQQMVDRRQKVDPMFDPELMRHYEKIPVIEYPKVIEERRLNNETLDDRMLDYNNRREELIQKAPMNTPFQTRKIEKEEDTDELMKSYNAKLKEYENQMMSINNFDEGQKSLNQKVENDLDRRVPYESVEENLFINNKEPVNELLIGEYFGNKNSKNIKMQINKNANQFIINKEDDVSLTHLSAPFGVTKDDKKIILPETIKTYEYDRKENIKKEPQQIYSDLFEKEMIPKRDNNLINEKNPIDRSYNENNNNRLDYSPFNNTQLTSTILPTKKEIKTKTYTIIIFSFFRNKKLYPNQTYFEVKFNPSGNSYTLEPYIDSHDTLIYRGKTLVYGENGANIPITFDNIKQIRIKDVTCPVIANYVGGRGPVVYNGPSPVSGQIGTNTFSQYNPIATKSTGIPMSVYKEPAIYLLIPELEHSYYTTSDFGRKIFSKLIPDYGSNDGFQTIYTSLYTILKPSDSNETYKYDPVLRGKIDKFTLSLYNYHGEIYNFGIDKLFIENISKGELRYGGYCGKPYNTTKILIKKQDKSYSSYCSTYSVNNEYCDTLNSHPVAPGDLIYFYNTQPLINNYIYLEDYVKVDKLDKTNAPNYIVLYAGYTKEEKNNQGETITKDYNVIFKDFIPGGNINNKQIYEEYSIILRIKEDGLIGLKTYVLNVLGFEPNGGVRLEYSPKIENITDLNQIEQIGWVQNNLEGSNSEDKNSLFYKQGFNVIRVGEFNNIDQLETEDVNEFLIEIDYPFHYLPDNLNPENMNNDFSPGDIFFIQQKLQVHYTFEIECDIINSDNLVSNIQGSGLNF